MNNTFGFTHPALIEKLETLSDTNEGRQALMRWIRAQKEIEVAPHVVFLQYSDGTYGTRCPTRVLDTLPDDLTDLMYEWNFHFGMDEEVEDEVPWDGDEDDSMGRDAPMEAKFHGE